MVLQSVGLQFEIVIKYCEIREIDTRALYLRNLVLRKQSLLGTMGTGSPLYIVWHDNCYYSHGVY